MGLAPAVVLHGDILVVGVGFWEFHFFSTFAFVVLVCLPGISSLKRYIFLVPVVVTVSWMVLLFLGSASKAGWLTVMDRSKAEPPTTPDLTHQGRQT